MSKKPVLLGTILAGIIVIAILSAGCVGAFSYCPDEVKVHGNIIAVDENVVGEETIRQLLLSPNSYESSYISAIESNLPKKNSVIEIGAKFGVVTAFVDDIINKNVAHVIIEEDPDYYELLLKTIKNNEIVGIPLNVKITSSVSDYLDNENVETISSIIASNDVLKDLDNITLLIDDDNVAMSFFTKESGIESYVEYIIINMKDSSLVKSVIKQASLFGYTNITYPVQGSDGYTVLVFKRMNKNNTDGLTLNNDLRDTNDTPSGTDTTPKIDVEVKVA